MYNGTKTTKDGFGRIGIILLLPFIVLVLAYGAYKLFLVPDPVVHGIEAFTFLPAEKTVKLDSENIRSIEINIYQDGKTIEVLKEVPDTGEKVYSLDLRPKELGLTDGKAIVSITAKSGMLKKIQHDIESVIDTIPPVLRIIKSPSVIHLGSSGFTVLRAGGEESVFITLVDKDQPGEDNVFRAFKVSPGDGGEADGTRGSARRDIEATYYAFFPAPFESGERSTFYAVATDTAGNRNIQALPVRLKMEKYNSSSINIDDGFINRVISPLLNATHIPDPAAAFKEVNEEWRQQSLLQLIDIAKQTEPRILWKGRFLQLKNSKVMATYGDRRTYLYKGNPISKSAHLGYDLASYAQAPVDAANAGIVRYAGNLSIYGNTVIIDHGLGLMTLYGHLSTINVNVGQEVSQGEIIAHTGATGLAGGDHLHFSMLIHGYEISPLYWWDANWVRVNVTDLLN